METLSQTIPQYNWPLTERFLKDLKYLEGRDYTVVHSKLTVVLTFSYRFQWDRYWLQWGRHITRLPQ